MIMVSWSMKWLVPGYHLLARVYISTPHPIHLPSPREERGRGEGQCSSLRCGLGLPQRREERRESPRSSRMDLMKARASAFGLLCHFGLLGGDNLFLDGLGNAAVF